MSRSEPKKHNQPEIAPLIHGLNNAYFLFIFNNMRKSDNLLFDNLMLLFNREGSFHTESAPMES